MELQSPARDIHRSNSQANKSSNTLDLVCLKTQPEVFITKEFKCLKAAVREKPKTHKSLT